MNPIDRRGHAPKRYAFDRDTGGGRCELCGATIYRDPHAVKQEDGRFAYLHFVCLEKVQAAGPDGIVGKFGTRIVAEV